MPKKFSLDPCQRLEEYIQVAQNFIEEVKSPEYSWAQEIVKSITKWIQKAQSLLATKGDKSEIHIKTILRAWQALCANIHFQYFKICENKESNNFQDIVLALILIFFLYLISLKHTVKYLTITLTHRSLLIPRRRDEVYRKKKTLASTLQRIVNITNNQGWGLQMEKHLEYGY